MRSGVYQKIELLRKWAGQSQSITSAFVAGRWWMIKRVVAKAQSVTVELEYEHFGSVGRLLVEPEEIGPIRKLERDNGQETQVA